LEVTSKRKSILLKTSSKLKRFQMISYTMKINYKRAKKTSKKVSK